MQRTQSLLFDLFFFERKENKRKEISLSANSTSRATCRVVACIAKSEGGGKNHSRAQPHNKVKINIAESLVLYPLDRKCYKKKIKQVWMDISYGAITERKEKKCIYTQKFTSSPLQLGHLKGMFTKKKILKNLAI